MARKKEQSDGGAPEWMTTYSDMVTLLLCFFIMLFAMSTVDKATFTEMAESLANSLIKLNSGDSILEHAGTSIISLNFAEMRRIQEQDKEGLIEDAEEMIVDAKQQIEDKKIDAVKDSIRETMDESDISDRVNVTEEHDFLLISLESEVFFDSGSAEIRPEGVKVLTSIAQVLKSIDNEILVSGHTDNIPIKNSKFASNWELSTARATNVVKYFVEVEGLDPTLLTATGNGEFRPIADNNTSEGRQKNRRIEIKILKK
ncbi:MAG: flagellar motor protein MotB [Clostridiaceae bacterium]|nr:flagellar motor protein MotB [Clostridiaceae bacterium]